MYRFILITAAFTVAKTQRALEQESKSMSPGNVTVPIPTKRERERCSKTQNKSTQHYFDTETVGLYSIRTCLCVCILVYFFTVHCVVYYIHRSYIKGKRGTHRYIRHKYKKVKVHKVQSFYFYGNKRTGIRLFCMVCEAMWYSLPATNQKSKTVSDTSSLSLGKDFL